MARKKRHPADIENDAIIARADHFEVAHFLGVGRYVRASAPTFVEAEREAGKILKAHPNGRRPIIYAIDANGRAGLITETNKELAR